MQYATLNTDMKYLIILLLSAVSVSAQLSGTLKETQRNRYIIYTNVVFSPSFTDTHYTVKVQSSGGNSQPQVLTHRTNWFRLKCSPGTTNVVWSVKHD